jgi:hypothetical protein
MSRRDLLSDASARNADPFGVYREVNRRGLAGAVADEEGSRGNIRAFHSVYWARMRSNTSTCDARKSIFSPGSRERSKQTFIAGLVQVLPIRSTARYPA